MKVNVIIKRLIFISVITVSVFALVFISRKISTGSEPGKLAEVKEGIFMVTVTSVGELMAENPVEVKGPVLPVSNRRGSGRRRSIRAVNVEISDIVPEGTIVKKGDYIAQLDRTDYENTLKDEIDRLENLKTDLRMMVLDTAIALTSLRYELKNQYYIVEEARLTLEKSMYEPPAIIRQAEMALDRERRKLSQKQKTYKLRLQQELKDINNQRLYISRQERLISELENYLAEFTVTSPVDGMVVYKRNWNGTKRKAGSTISPFDMVVATLPDLASLVSRTYISEIDIGKLKPDQEVNVKVDAFRKKDFTGRVKSIARIGEILPNSDTKVFEVIIKLDQKNPDLRPSMTTTNEIIIKSIDDAVFIPLESVRADKKGYTYVYTSDRRKQVVLLGASNNKDVVIEKGLDPGSEVFLARPDDYMKFRLSGEDLIDSDVSWLNDEGSNLTSD